MLAVVGGLFFFRGVFGSEDAECREEEGLRAFSPSTLLLLLPPPPLLFLHTNVLLRKSFSRPLRALEIRSPSFPLYLFFY